MGYEMRHFEESEFQGWFESMSPQLLALLDALRELWGAPIFISSANGAVGRTSGGGYHDFIVQGEVRAVDIQPSGLDNAKKVREFFTLAKSLGFTGIGFYPQWNRAGFHIDVRPTGALATWGAYYVINEKGEKEQFYYSLAEAMADYERMTKA